MVALRKDVKVGLTIGGIVVAVVGVYAGLSALAGAKPANAESTASLQTSPPPSNAAKGTSGIADRTGDRTGDRTPRTTEKIASTDTPKAPPALTGTGSSSGNGSPAIANPEAPIAAGNRKGGEDPWQNAFASGHVEPAVTVTPEPGKPANGAQTGTQAGADRGEIIRAITGGTDPAKTTASTNEPNGAVAGGAAQSTLTKASDANHAGDQTHVVAPGETFSAISAEYYGDAKHVKLILDANPGVNPNKLKPGTSIRIPLMVAKAAGPTTAPAATARADAKIDPTKQYVVKPGDSLHKIASELYNDISYATKLYDANKALIGPDAAKLKVGTILTLTEAPKKK